MNPDLWTEAIVNVAFATVGAGLVGVALGAGFAPACWGGLGLLLFHGAINS